MCKDGLNYPWNTVLPIQLCRVTESTGVDNLYVRICMFTTPTAMYIDNMYSYVH